ncbi:Ig-like domain-containing protein, partial [Streptomyces sp. TRM76130]|nr:Ig-like domain-containing protein [Streptomyces sp. TRM76130]
MKVRPIAGTSARGRGGRRLSAVAVGALLLVVTACGGGEAHQGSGEAGTGMSKTARSQRSAAVVSIAPADGATSVDTSGALEVGVARGRLTEVVVEDDEGRKVDGEISGDGATWTPSSHLAASTAYSVHAVAEDSEGRTAAEDSRFTTLTPKDTFIGTFTPEDGSEVGVGMPFSIRFSRGITHPEDVEKAISITTEPAVDVEGHWFGDDRIDFRPEEYWKAGTEVTVGLNLDGVEGRDGVYGEQAKT